MTNLLSALNFHYHSYDIVHRQPRDRRFPERHKPFVIRAVTRAKMQG
jgi:hypothetical protein